MRAASTIAMVVSLTAGACTGGHTEHTYPPLIDGDPERGALVIREKGCGACHTIPGIRGARGEVGPPLSFFARRTYIAGQVPNTPYNLARWVQHPHAIEPGTAMPMLGLTDQQARDVTAYLYTLE